MAAAIARRLGPLITRSYDPTPRKPLQWSDMKACFTMPGRTAQTGWSRLASCWAIAPDDLPFFTRLHALPEVAQNLYPGGRPRSPKEDGRMVAKYTLASYEQLALAISRSAQERRNAESGAAALWTSLSIRGTRARDSRDGSGANRRPRRRADIRVF